MGTSIPSQCERINFLRVSGAVTTLSLGVHRQFQRQCVILPCSNIVFVFRVCQIKVTVECNECHPGQTIVFLVKTNV